LQLNYLFLLLIFDVIFLVYHFLQLLTNILIITHILLIFSIIGHSVIIQLLGHFIKLSFLRK